MYDITYLYSVIDYHGFQADSCRCWIFFWYNLTLLSDIVLEGPFYGGIMFLLYNCDLFQALLLFQWCKLILRISKNSFCICICEISLPISSSIILGDFLNTALNVYCVMEKWAIWGISFPMSTCLFPTQSSITLSEICVGFLFKMDLGPFVCLSLCENSVSSVVIFVNPTLCVVTFSGLLGSLSPPVAWGYTTPALVYH